MKKYVKLLMLAVFATVSMTLVACHDDKDDEPVPGGGGGSTSLSINGSNFSFNAGSSTLSSDELLVVLFDYPNVSSSLGIYFYEVSEMTSGMVLTADTEWDSLFGPVSLVTVDFEGYADSLYVLNDGSVKIDSINEESITATFSDAEFVDAITHDSPLTVNGTFSVKFNDVWAPGV